MQKLTILLFLIAGVMLAFLHFLSLELYLYWRFLWLDIPMHALGGSVVALSLFAGYALKWPVPRRWLGLFPVILIVTVVALAWEVFELIIRAPVVDNFVLDTVTDLVAGLLGGLAGYSIGNRFNKSQF